MQNFLRFLPESTIFLKGIPTFFAGIYPFLRGISAFFAGIYPFHSTFWQKAPEKILEKCKGLNI